MKIPGSRKLLVVGFALSALAAAPAAAAPLTADQAAALALRNSVQSVGADAAVLDARGTRYSAYSGILPHVSVVVNRNNSVTTGDQSPVFGSFGPTITRDFESHGTTPQVVGRWNFLDFSALKSWQAAGSGLRAAERQRTASRNDVVFAVKQQFYSTVQSYNLARVAAGGLRVARDNERRVNALFQVGSVSKSDLLQAQVRTAQAELDSLTANGNILDSRVLLADQIGVTESELGEIDTVLTATHREYNLDELQREAEANRPDLQAAKAALHGAKSNRTSARLSRIPSLEASSSVAFNTTSRNTFTVNPPGSPSDGVPPGIAFNVGETERDWRGTLALNWNVFDGLATEGRNASTEASLRRAQVNHDALQRRVSGEVRQAVLTYQEATERDRVANRAFEAAMENLKLTQQKYNVGSATILELVDAQEQSVRAAAELVVARALIRTAEAAIERVRGRGE